MALLGWRLTHGLAAASVVVTRSVVRDLYSGRHMARVMSLTFIVFLMVPVIAPSLGQLMLLLAPWRYIFIVCGGFATLVWLWALLRLPETLHPEYRLILTRSHIAGAIRLVLGNRISLCYTLAMGVMFGSLLAYVGMVQQIFSEVFHRPRLMPTMFALCAGSMGVAAFLNSRMVERLSLIHIFYVTGWCGYCRRAKQLLTSKNLAFNEINVDDDVKFREEMLARSGATTVPQIFVGDKHVGGCDDLYALCLLYTSCTGRSARPPHAAGPCRGGCG